jgi:hypothetical protein
MKIVLIILGGFLVANVIAGVICYVTLAVPNRKPLSPEERELCRQLIKQQQAYPFLCRQSVKLGLCPCLPCKKLEQAKAAIQQ